VYAALSPPEPHTAKPHRTKSDRFVTRMRRVANSRYVRAQLTQWDEPCSRVVVTAVVCFERLAWEREEQLGYLKAFELRARHDHLVGLANPSACGSSSAQAMLSASPVTSVTARSTDLVMYPFDPAADVEDRHSAFARSGNPHLVTPPIGQIDRLDHQRYSRTDDRRESVLSTDAPVFRTRTGVPGRLRMSHSGQMDDHSFDRDPISTPSGTFESHASTLSKESLEAARASPAPKEPIVFVAARIAVDKAYEASLQKFLDSEGQWSRYNLQFLESNLRKSHLQREHDVRWLLSTEASEHKQRATLQGLERQWRNYWLQLRGDPRRFNAAVKAQTAQQPAVATGAAATATQTAQATSQAQPQPQQLRTTTSVALTSSSSSSAATSTHAAKSTTPNEVRARTPAHILRTKSAHSSPIPEDVGPRSPASAFRLKGDDCLVDEDRLSQTTTSTHTSASQSRSANERTDSASTSAVTRFASDAKALFKVWKARRKRLAEQFREHVDAVSQEMRAATDRLRFVEQEIRERHRVHHAESQWFAYLNTTLRRESKALRGYFNLLEKERGWRGQISLEEHIALHQVIADRPRGKRYRPPRDEAPPEEKVKVDAATSNRARLWQREVVRSDAPALPSNDDDLWSLTNSEADVDNNDDGEEDPDILTPDHTTDSRGSHHHSSGAALTVESPIVLTGQRSHCSGSSPASTPAYPYAPTAVLQLLERVDGDLMISTSTLHDAGLSYGSEGTNGRFPVPNRSAPGLDAERLDPATTAMTEALKAFQSSLNACQKLRETQDQVLREFEAAAHRYVLSIQ
jgi:hypothetical protein